MTRSDPMAPDPAVERALEDFAREMEAFATSWMAAVRRFAEEPAALRHFRERPAVEARKIAAHLDRPFVSPPDPMWDRELDG